MKQTNNAIKFLMAQYRAIFKNANIAMVAAMAAAALAAGSANAATANDVNLEDKAEWDAALTAGNGTITITGAKENKGEASKFQNIKIDATASTELTLNDGQKLVITDKTTDYRENSISATGQDINLNIKGQGDLHVTAHDKAGAPRGLFIKAVDSGSVNLTFDDAIVDGILHMATSGSDTSSTATLVANNIVIGKDTLAAPDASGKIYERATLYLGESGAVNNGSGSVTLGNENTVITINKSGKLRPLAQSGATGTTINAAQVNVNGGILSVATAVGDGKVNYKAAKTTVNDGWLSVKTGANLVLDMGKTGTMTFAGNSTIDVGSIVSVANGTIDVGAETVLAGREGVSDETAQIKLGGAKGNDATLSINKQTLKSFLTAKAANGSDPLKYVDEHAQFTDSNNKLKNAVSGTLVVGSGGVLEIKDDVDLAKDLTFAATATSGSIFVDNGGKVAGTDVTISAAITTPGDHLAVKATNLTLGKAEAALATKLGVKSLEAENVTFINKDADFNLLEKLTLSTTGTGTIKGGLKIGADNSGASVTINGGSYTFEAGKNLETHKSGSIVLNNASTLDVSGVKNLKLAVSGTTATVQLTGGSTLVLHQTDVFKKGSNPDDIVLVDDNSGSKITKEAISTDATSVLEFKLSDTFKGSGGKFTMSKTQVENVKNALAKDGLDGIISFGNNFVLSGLSGSVALNDVIENADVYDGNGVKAENGTVDRGVVAGNISIGASADKATISTGKNVILYNAGNSGFVSKGGKAAAVALSGTASLTLAGAGSIGAIDGGAANEGSVIIGHSKKETSAVVAESIGATKAVKSVDLQGKSTLTLTKENAKLQTQVLNVGDDASLVAEKQEIVVSSAGGSDSTILGNVTAKSVEFKDNGTATDYVVAGGALLDVDTLSLSSNSGSLFVGKDGTGTSAGHLEVGTLALNGGNLIVDPEWEADASIAHIKSMGGNGGSGDAIQLDGKLGVGKNSVLGFGFDSAQDVKDLFTTYGYMTDDGKKLNKDKIQAALVLNKPLKIAADQGVLIDPAKTGTALKTAVSDSNFKNKFEFGANTGLVITDGAYQIDQDGKKTGSAVSFAATGATVSGSGKVVLAGYFTGADKDITIFSGSTLNGTGTVDLVSLNGLITAKVELSTGKIHDGSWTFDKDNKLDTYYTSASKPVSDLLKDVMSGTIKGNTIGYKFLGKVANSDDKSGVLADAAAHAATYAGAQQAAVASVTTMADAMFGRVGAVGVEAASIAATGSQANGGVWLTPMYKSMDSDGFNAEGASYGSDVDLSGVAFGADTVNGNMRFGAVFNIGSGDAEGKGNGNGLKDEFDYYGFGIYSAMGFGNFALVGDASMTVISHDVEGHGLKGKADTTAVTMGVTGQYSIATPVVDVTPHLGARFIRLNTDSYDLMSADGVLATTDFDVQNVFSVPLGVTLSKGFAAGGWTLAPSADLTVAFNTGDTEAKSKTTFTGVPSIDLTTEVLDEVTYGVSLGLGAQYGAFGTSFGINYTGSSNTDSFGVNAQARYMF